jgi:RND family efflux transporter MFP subunit
MFGYVSAWPLGGDIMRAYRLFLLLPLMLCLGAADPVPNAARPVRVVTVAIAPLASRLVFSGTVQARTQADLGFRVGGKVVARPVEVGDHVRAGQLLARIDQTDLALSVESAAAALDSAQADAVNARADLARYERLGRSSPAYLPSEYDKRGSASRMADARVVQAARQLALARSQLGYGDLTADADGVITALPVQVGQVVAAGQTVATLAHTDAIEIVADVPENRLADIRAAGDAAIALWAAPGRALHGHVREIGALADPATRTFAVKVAVTDAPPDLLNLGMTASVSFGVAAAPVARLPATALTDRGGHPAVWVLDPARQRAALRPVEVAGYGGDGSVLVAGGLAEGDMVVTAGVGQIEPDAALTPWQGAAR